MRYFERTKGESSASEVALPVRDEKSFDVVVVGGGIGGTMAALGASRQGARVLLVEQHGFVGGQASAGGVHTFCGETRLVNASWREMVGRLESLDAIAPYNPNDDGRMFEPEYLKYVLQEMLSEAGVEMLLHTSFLTAERRGDRIDSVILHNKSGVQRINCRFAVDATGDVDLVAAGGWCFEKGGPVFQPGDPPRVMQDGTQLQLPMSVYFAMVDTGKDATTRVPDSLPCWDGDNEVPMITVFKHENMIVVKMKVIGHDATDGWSLARAELVGRRQIIAMAHHLQTKGYKGTTYATYRLAWVAPHIGVREGRRVQAQYRMTLDDVLSGRRFDDAVAVGSYHTDYHWPTVVQRAGTGLTTQCPPYQIPLRAMRPEGASNALVPGRGMSGDQVAMSSFRVMGTCAQTGFAAGTVAGIACSENQEIDDIKPVAIRERLRAQGARLDLAPYANYLRVRRAIREHVMAAPSTKSCHASTLAVLPNGDVLTAWFGGEHEGAPDVGIYVSIRSEGAWSAPQRVADQGDEPCWNPVLFLADDHRSFADAPGKERDELPVVWLYYRVGSTIPTWRSYSMVSKDGGRTWSAAAPLGEDILGPIKNKPIPLSDGRVLAGTSIEDERGWRCAIEVSEDGGGHWARIAEIESDADVDLIQPTVWESGPGHVHALMRSRTAGKIYRSDSLDGGRTWSRALPTELPNNNSGLDIAKLVPAPGDPGYESGQMAPLALAFNPVTEGRSPLVVAVSTDNGATWHQSMPIEDNQGEYSYPSIVPTSDGIAMTYTYDRRNIGFVRASWEHLIGRADVETMPGGDHRHSGHDWIDELRALQDTPSRNA